MSSTWLMELHEGRRLAALLQLLQLCYGLGMIAGPALVAPFLAGVIPPESPSPELLLTQRRHSLTLPYLIGGLLQSSGKIDIMRP